MQGEYNAKLAVVQVNMSDKRALNWFFCIENCLQIGFDPRQRHSRAGKPNANWHAVCIMYWCGKKEYMGNKYERRYDYEPSAVSKKVV